MIFISFYLAKTIQILGHLIFSLEERDSSLQTGSHLKEAKAEVIQEPMEVMSLVLEVPYQSLGKAKEYMVGVGQDFLMKILVISLVCWPLHL